MCARRVLFIPSLSTWFLGFNQTHHPPITYARGGMWNLLFTPMKYASEQHSHLWAFPRDTRNNAEVKTGELLRSEKPRCGKAEREEWMAVRGGTKEPRHVGCKLRIKILWEIKFLLWSDLGTNLFMGIFLGIIDWGCRWVHHTVSFMHFSGFPHCYCDYQRGRI